MSDIDNDHIKKERMGRETSKEEADVMDDPSNVITEEWQNSNDPSAVLEGNNDNEITVKSEDSNETDDANEIPNSDDIDTVAEGSDNNEIQVNNENDNETVHASDKQDKEITDGSMKRSKAKDENERNVHENNVDDVVNNKNAAGVEQEAKQLPDIVYDDTKPKRLPNPRKLKLDVPSVPSEQSNALHESINVLISPDEAPVGSPKRRGRRRDGYDFGVRTNIDTSQIIDQQFQPSHKSSHAHNSKHKDPGPVRRYDRSPEIERKHSARTASPVQRLIIQKGPSSSAHHMTRKISSDARMMSAQDKMQLQIPPKRKISSDARLENLRLSDTVNPMPNLTIEQMRKRKVSFDTTALINGIDVMPLNDEVFEEKHSFPEDEDHFETNERAPSPNHIPKVYLTTEDEQSNTHVSEIRRFSGDDDNGGDDMNAYINRGYIQDDEESQSMSSGSPPPGYTECFNQEQAQTLNYLSSEPAVIPHTNVNLYDRFAVKKVSVSSRRSSDGGTPKSILKHRKEDGESIASEDSVAVNKFKVRKDSIALFTDQNGDIALQELRKTYKSPWRCVSKKNFKQMWSNRKLFLQKYKLHLVVLMLFLMTLVFVVVGLHFHSVHHKNLAIAQKIFFDSKPKTFFLHDIEEEDTFTGNIGQNLPAWMLPSHCYQNYQQILDRTCLKWKKYAQLDIMHFIINNTQCYNITWKMENGNLPHDCFRLGGGSWYGPVNMTEGQWPIKRSKFEYNMNSVYQDGSGTFSSALEYYWLSSNGHAVIVEANTPVILNWNMKKPGYFCFIGTKSNDFYKSESIHQIFHYTVCNGKDMYDTHKTIRERFFPKLQSLPDRSLIEYPHFSSVYDSDGFNVNETVVLDLANTISHNKLNCSTIEIDGKWEKTYGDFIFNQRLFTNLSDMVSNVGNSGCELAVNIYPYFNFHSINFQEGMSHGFFVKDIGKRVPALLKWQHGVGAMLDISNPTARDWIENKLRNVISRYNIKTFRLVYGSDAWVPHNALFHTDDLHPISVKNMFSELISSLGRTKLQSTAKSQHIPSLVGISSHIDTFEQITCLKNIIPEALTLGLMGYPFISSDGFFMDKTILPTDETRPSREIYVRWMQISTFFPAMRYTIKPWQYDKDVISLARNLSKLHAEHIVPAVFDAEPQILAGLPIIMPLWMGFSRDSTTFDINDQFLVASKYLVAPVFCESMEGSVAERDIYIPRGVWKDMTGNKVVIGPKWVKNYKVKLFEIPFFEKLPEW